MMGSSAVEVSDHFVGFDQIQTRSVERAIAPLIHQVTLLTGNNPNTHFAYNAKGGRSKNAEVLVAAVERSIDGFIDQTQSIIQHPSCNPIMANKLFTALDHVKKTGLDMVTSSADFIKDTCSSQKRASMVIAARLLLTDIARLLIIADRIDVDLFVSAVNKAKSDLDSMKNASSNNELMELNAVLEAQLDTITKLAHRRGRDLINVESRDNMHAARALLKTNSPIMYTASKAFVRHPEIDAGRMNRDYAHAQLSHALQSMDDIVQGRHTDQLLFSPNDNNMGRLVAELDNFQNRVYLDPQTFNSSKSRPELEELLERIVSGAAHIADSESTRDDRKQRIVTECNALRQALQDLLTEYERNTGRKEPTEDLDLSLVHLGRKTKDLHRHLRRAVVDHVSDAFLDTQVPLLVLIDAAERQDADGVESAGQLFIEHAAKLVDVSHLVCQMSNNLEGIRMIKYAARQVAHLAPQVVNAARLLCSRADSRVAQENMAAFRETWEDKVRLLTLAVDSIISVDDFLAVSEAHIVEDVKASIKATYERDGDTLDRTAGAIRGRSLRVCDVVDAEMDLQSAGTYTERVRAATRILRVDVLPQFATKAESAVKLLLSGNSDAKVDIDEFIDAASLVHEAVRNIREALLLNRNAEDIDSDNEYIDDTDQQADTVVTTTTAAAASTLNRQNVADADNQQNIMRSLPEEDKRKIQEQIDVFKIVQTKFEKEVAKWDESGNDIIVLAKHMCIIMMNMTDFTRGRGPLKTTMDVIRAAQEISDAGAKLNNLSKQIGDESVESETKKDLFAYLQRITLYCQQLNITSRVKADVQQVGDELIVSGLESAMSLIQTARNLLNAVVLTVKSAYIASTKYRKNKTSKSTLVEWRMAPPQKQPLLSRSANANAIVRRASDKRPMPPMRALAQFHN